MIEPIDIKEEANTQYKEPSNTFLGKEMFKLTLFSSFLKAQLQTMKVVSNFHENSNQDKYWEQSDKKVETSSTYPSCNKMLSLVNLFVEMSDKCLL